MEADEAPTTDERDTAAGIRFVHTAEAEELDEGDERPCAYCNPPTSVDERVGEARKWMEQTLKDSTRPSHYENPLPEGITVEIDFSGVNKDCTIAGHEKNDETQTVIYETDRFDNIEAYMVTDIVAVPRDIGKVKADYVFTFGHDDGEGVEVPVCHMCLGDMPVEWADETTINQMSYKYGGDGEVRETVTLEEYGETVKTSVPVDETGERLTEVDSL